MSAQRSIYIPSTSQCQHKVVSTCYRRHNVRTTSYQHATDMFCMSFTDQKVINSITIRPKKLTYLLFACGNRTVLLNKRKETVRDIALTRILETVVTFHFSGGKVYSVNKGCHTCMIKHTMHVQSLHRSTYLTWLDVCIYVLEAIFTY